MPQIQGYEPLCKLDRIENPNNRILPTHYLVNHNCTQQFTTTEVLYHDCKCEDDKMVEFPPIANVNWAMGQNTFHYDSCLVAS